MTNTFYAGIDLHSNNCYIAILDNEDKVVAQKRLPNELPAIFEYLSPWRDQMAGTVIESTYNWYWLVDALQKGGYAVYLANTAAIQQYSGLKYTDDKSDAVWLARMLRLGILATGYIYPKEMRGVRELLRRRMILVRQQTMVLLGIKSMITRYENITFTAQRIKRYCGDEENMGEKILNYIQDEHVRMAVQTEMKILYCILQEVTHLESCILQEIKGDKNFELLKTIPGVGPVLAMTILLEAGDISRFKKSGNFSSYCRCVSTKRISNEKKKGSNNKKNGNPYLEWAFVEAAHHAIRSAPPIKKYYQRKTSKTKLVVARKAIASKLSKACYFMLRDGVPFDVKKAFC